MYGLENKNKESVDKQEQAKKAWQNILKSKP